jgi:hypothetical protein
VGVWVRMCVKYSLSHPFLSFSWVRRKTKFINLIVTLKPSCYSWIYSKRSIFIDKFRGSNAYNKSLFFDSSYVVWEKWVGSLIHQSTVTSKLHLSILSGSIARSYESCGPCGGGDCTHQNNSKLFVIIQ